MTDTPAQLAASLREPWHHADCRACADLIEAQAAQIEALRADAERGRYMLKNASWYHSVDDRTMIVVQVASGSDLYCYATRKAAIDAAMAAKETK